MTKHQEALDRLKLRPGDRVKVLRESENHADGWDNDWVSSMDRSVGGVFTVKAIGTSSGVPLDDNFRYPATCLARVNQMVDCTIPE